MYVKPTIALLISTYNWPEALTLCLESGLRQTVLPNEFIIADDGSGPETKSVVDRFRDETTEQFVHVWHEDKGFRLCHIRNKAIAQAKSDYIIQIDGDVILDKDFIKDHVALRKDNRFVIGSRAMLNKEFSERLLASQTLSSAEEFRRNAKNKMNAKRIPWLTPLFSSRYKNRGKYTYYAKGCNMAFWRKSIIEINGYNEDIEGWGAEDSELIARLMMLGEKKLFLKFAGIQYHIWHKFASRDREETNDAILENTIASQSFRTVNGIDKYL
ncbi:glycosyltransferase family 2 protein [Limibacterium fermenti]|uniref:glycosyltransferase family 2 protein n=1 Tax=Limibacterium fermenti TaxID=3229863 RepID=UPI000E89FC4A|nr:glycosyl transferase family 2 [Porphyromonadaceae bacterium]